MDAQILAALQPINNGQEEQGNTIGFGFRMAINHQPKAKSGEPERIGTIGACRWRRRRLSAAAESIKKAPIAAI